MGTVVSSSPAREINEDHSIKWIEMQELSRLQVCQYCQSVMEKDEVDAIIPTYDHNNNEVRFEVKRIKIASEQCERKNKDRIITEQNQRQSTQNKRKRTSYARQTSRGS